MYRKFTYGNLPITEKIRNISEDVKPKLCIELTGLIQWWKFLDFAYFF